MVVRSKKPLLFLAVSLFAMIMTPYAAYAFGVSWSPPVDNNGDSTNVFSVQPGEICQVPFLLMNDTNDDIWVQAAVEGEDYNQPINGQEVASFVNADVGTGTLVQYLVPPFTSGWTGGPHATLEVSIPTFDYASSYFVFATFTTFSDETQGGIGLGESIGIRAYFDVEAPPAPVPEPQSLIFFGTGLVGVVGYVVRRRNR